MRLPLVLLAVATFRMAYLSANVKSSSAANADGDDRIESHGLAGLQEQNDCRRGHPSGELRDPVGDDVSDSAAAAENTPSVTAGLKCAPETWPPA